jgi:CSLREA domain-containing protein
MDMTFSLALPRAFALWFAAITLIFAPFAKAIADKSPAPFVSQSLVVTTATDEVDPNAGALSLREALALANSSNNPVTINFSNNTINGAANFYDGNPHTITLTAGELLIRENVTINGPGANLLVINGNHAATGGVSQSAGTAALGEQLNTTGGNAVFDSPDVANALPATTYFFTSSGFSVTLTRTSDNVAETLDVSSGVPPNAHLILDFPTLGINVIIVSDSVGKTGAGLATDLAGLTITTAPGSSHPLNGRVFRIQARKQSPGDTVAVGQEFNTTGGNMSVLAVNVSGAQLGGTYTFSGSGTKLTLTRSIDNVAETIDLSSGVAADSEVLLDFPTLGVGIRVAADGGGKSGAGIATDLAAGTINVPVSPANTVAISGLTITNGSSNQNIKGGGGGILNDHSVVTISNCTVRGNSAGSGNNGGGIYNDGSNSGRATLEIVGSMVSGNMADIDGGGIFNDGSFGNATVTIVNSTFSNNSAVNGAAVYSFGTNGGNATLALLNSTLSGNSASGIAGGIYSDGRNFGSATLEIGNTILNGGSSGANIVNDSGIVVSEGYNLSSDAAGGDGLSGPGGFLNIGGDLRNTDPFLDPMGLKDNGGPTETIALQAASPAIDAGDPTFDPNAFTPALTTDQRGFSRVSNGRIDIGAYEFSAPPSASPIILPGSGTYHRQVKVMMRDATPGAVIHYTTDGSTPISASPVYFPSGGEKGKRGTVIVLRASTTIKAIAIANGFSNSLVAEADYIIIRRK